MKISINQLVEDERNPNVCDPETLRKIAKLIERQNGQYPPIIVRPVTPALPLGVAQQYIIIDGKHRKNVLLGLGYEEAECIVWNMNDDEAALALATLNRLHGEDDRTARDALLVLLANAIPPVDLVTLIPENLTDLTKAIERASGLGGMGKGEDLTHKISFKLDEAGFEVVKQAIQRAKEVAAAPDWSDGTALIHVCAEFLATYGSSFNTKVSKN